jgi:hypothetical protein
VLIAAIAAAVLQIFGAGSTVLSYTHASVPAVANNDVQNKYIKQQ